MIRNENLTTATPALEDFMHQCATLEYKNNDSLAAMKFDWCIKEGGEWYATYSDDQIIAVSGVHPFKDGYRVLFRGAQLHSMPSGLSKNHMSSYVWVYHIPMCIDRFGLYPLYITTNAETDSSGRMLRINKLFHHLEKQGLVDHISTEEVFFVKQNVWQLNIDSYEAMRYAANINV